MGVLKHCFSLVMYGFCSSSAFDSAVPSFMFIFLLTSFDAINSYYFKSNPSPVLFIKVFCTENLMLFFSFLNL